MSLALTGIDRTGFLRKALIKQEFLPAGACVGACEGEGDALALGGGDVGAGEVGSGDVAEGDALGKGEVGDDEALGADVGVIVFCAAGVAVNSGEGEGAAVAVGDAVSVFGG